MIKQKKNENLYNSLDKLMGDDQIRNLKNETQQLLGQQDVLMNQMKDISPLINEATSALSNLGSGNYVDLFNSLTSSLDKFYDKYPDTFPSDYKEQSNKLKEEMNNSIQLKQKFTDAYEKQEKEKTS